MGIYQKLHKLQQGIKSLAKDANGGQYDYVSPSKVLGVVRQMMDENGLLLKQEVTAIENQRQDYELGKGELKRVKSEVLTTLLMRFTWVDIDSGEVDVNMFAANGQNDFDKGVGSALTYGERYFLLKYFHIATDEDDCDYLSGKRSMEFEELLRKMKMRTTPDEVNKFYKANVKNLTGDYADKFYAACVEYGKQLKK